MVKIVLDADMLLFAVMSSNMVTVNSHDQMWVMQTDLADAAATYWEKCEELCDTFDADIERDLVHCFTEASRFRKAVFPGYKANRQGQTKPMMYAEMKAQLLNSGEIAFHHTQIEADDLIGILATQFKSIDEECVIASGDKDLVQIPGKHWWFNPFWGAKSKEELREFLTRFGMEEINERTFNVPESAANRFWWVQLLTGDATDGIVGAKGIGIKTAIKEVVEWDTSRPLECWQKAVGIYVKKKQTEEQAVQTARLIHLLRNGEYDFNDHTVSLWNPPTN